MSQNFTKSHTGTRKILGQINPAATSLTAIYTVPLGCSAHVTSIVVCDQGASGTFRICVGLAGATTQEAYIAWDTPIDLRTTIAYNLDIMLASDDVVYGYSSNVLTSFAVYGIEYQDF